MDAQEYQGNRTVALVCPTESASFLTLSVLTDFVSGVRYPPIHWVDLCNLLCAIRLVVGTISMTCQREGKLPCRMRKL